jgi:hypothetical protein
MNASEQGGSMFIEGDYAMLTEADNSVSCVIIGRVKPDRSFRIGGRVFNGIGQEQWVPYDRRAKVDVLTPERESRLSRDLEMPELGSVWLHDDREYRVLDHTNVGSSRPAFLPTVVYQAVDIAKHGEKKFSRTLVRWHARMVRKQEAVMPASQHNSMSEQDCEGTQFSDQMRCLRCAMTWDTNDSDPPPCPKTGHLARPCGRP